MRGLAAAGCRHRCEVDARAELAESLRQLCCERCLANAGVTEQQRKRRYAADRRRSIDREITE